jgi:hypothetical protein
MLEMAMENVKGLTDALDNMTKQLADVPHEMYQEMDQWQTEDVHFRRAFTRLITDTTVETVIWPRGRRRPKLKGIRWKGGKKKRVRVLRASRRHSKAKPIPVERPLLRPFLFDKLVVRMNSILEKISWQ